MTTNIIIGIVAVIAAIFVIGIITVLANKPTLFSEIETQITLAEAQNLTGAQKMERVVNTVYDSVIPILKGYFTKAKIEAIAQNIYDKMKEFYISRKRREDGEKGTVNDKKLE